MSSPLNPNLAADLPPLNLRRVVYLQANRPPTTSDSKYRSGAYYEYNTEWRDTSATPNPDVWKLVAINSATNAIWVKMTGGSSGPMLMVDVDAATFPGVDPVVADSTTGTMTISGTIVAAHSIPIQTHTLALNAFNIETQCTTSSTVGAKTINNAGLASFDSASFTVDAATGFVQLSGGGASVEHLTGDDGGALNPTANNFNILGQTVTNATNAKPVFVHGAVSTETVQVQVATTSTSGAKTINNAGLASFDSAAFTVDAATGFIGLIGGSSPAIEGIVVDAHTGPGTPVVIPASGNITVTGAQVAAGTTTNVIRTDSLAANTYTIEIQRSQAVASTTIGDNGVCHFNSAQFSVDANGFVSSLSTAVFAWIDKALSFNAASDNGYMSTAAAVVATLPLTPGNGTTIAFIASTADLFKIQPQTGDKIRVSSSLSTNGSGGGYIQTTAIGDSIELVYQVSSATWIALANNGNWTIN